MEAVGKLSELVVQCLSQLANCASYKRREVEVAATAIARKLVEVVAFVASGPVSEVVELAYRSSCCACRRTASSELRQECSASANATVGAGAVVACVAAPCQGIRGAKEGVGLVGSQVLQDPC